MHARQTVAEAQAVACRLAHHYLGTEHLLAALAYEVGSAAERALARCGVHGTAVEAHLEQVLGRGTRALSVQLPFTAAAEVVLTRSRWEARVLGEDIVSTTHILLALLRQPGGIAATVLAELGTDCAQLEGFVLAAPHDSPLDETGPLAQPCPQEPLLPDAGHLVEGFGSSAVESGGEARRSDRADVLAFQVVQLTGQVARLEAEVQKLGDLVQALLASIDPNGSGTGADRGPAPEDAVLAPNPPPTH